MTTHPHHGILPKQKEAGTASPSSPDHMWCALVKRELITDDRSVKQCISIADAKCIRVLYCVNLDGGALGLVNKQLKSTKIFVTKRFASSGKTVSNSAS